ncbi:MAG: Ig-like domain-containing protein, partial [Ornithinimicrobium sp.]
PDARITIVFSDFVDLETLSTETVTVRPVNGEALSGIYTYQFNQLSFSPDVPFLADTTYEVVMPTDGLMDAMGNGLSEETVMRFSTGSTVTIPDPPMVGTGGATMMGTGGTGTVDPTGSGGGFVAPTTSGGSTAAGTGGDSGGAVTPGASDPSGSFESGGCAVSPIDGTGNHVLGFGLLGALVAFARRKRRWI